MVQHLKADRWRKFQLQCITYYAVRVAGNWEKDQRHGQGKLIMPNGDYYVGGFRILKKFCSALAVSCLPSAGEFKDDHKHGAGAYVYVADGKDAIYRGEWVDDAPRCGTLEHTQVPVQLNAVPDSATGPLLQWPPPRAPLPRLRLQQPDAVLAEAVAQAHSASVTSSIDVTGKPAWLEHILTLDLTPAEIEQLRSAFLAADTSDSGAIPATTAALAQVLRELGTAASDEDLAVLLQDLQNRQQGDTHGRGDYISFAVFAATMTELREK